MRRHAHRDTRGDIRAADVRRVRGAQWLRLWGALWMRARIVAAELYRELGRLNRARIGSEEFSRLSARERARAVKGALKAHHRNSGRCC